MAYSINIKELPLVKFKLKWLVVKQQQYSATHVLVSRTLYLKKKIKEFKVDYSKHCNVTNFLCI